MPDQLQILETIQQLGQQRQGYRRGWVFYGDIARALNYHDDKQFKLQIATMVEEGLLHNCPECSCGSVKITELGGAFLAVCNE